MAATGMIKQNMARKAEKALKEILDKADSNLNGKVGLKEFSLIMEANGVDVSKQKEIDSPRIISTMYIMTIITKPWR